MQSYHIHIRGMVQGVGFRPFVCRVALAMDINGWISNASDGVHIECTGDESTTLEFYHHILQHSPKLAVITSYDIKEIPLRTFQGFSILQEDIAQEPDLLLTPDIALCADCRKEIHESTDRRHQYAFTTCLQCGPRYSIIQSLPYERVNTTMAPFSMCRDCNDEYHDIQGRRHYSQTNSCPSCAIQMELTGFQLEQDQIIAKAAQLILQGKILAVKGIGGYMLICDATNAEVINTLRLRKNRPAKPFAVMFPSLAMAKLDANIRTIEEKALLSRYAPILLCAINKRGPLEPTAEYIAPGLEKLGVLLPYSPLLELISTTVGAPLIATSGNISGSPIIYKDEEALQHLTGIADHVLLYIREIVTPQDDSVVQYTEQEQLIILRRARGLAPSYVPMLFPDNGTYLAMGAELKSAFAIRQKNNLYVSQYLGNQYSLESQEAYKETLEHFQNMLRLKPKEVIIDAHPNYQVSALGREWSEKSGASLLEVQHHHAHVAAVLAEHKLLDSSGPILGFAWDGTGYGDDGQIWGSETFVYAAGKMERVAHLKYFPQLLGDKMSREPRLSALSLLHYFQEYHHHIARHFTTNEWNLYQRLLNQETPVKTSSMGRFLDALACILGITTHNSYEGEAAMQLEALAISEKHRTKYSYPLPLVNGVLDWEVMLDQFMHDVQLARSRGWIALKIFNALADAIIEISEKQNISQLAFSGGVFQNAFLVNIIQEKCKGKKKLYFHKLLSPNDECIGVGQLALSLLREKYPAHQSSHNHVFSHTR
ncbi:MAG: carbamoyltransferase HypF [Chitinophagaceae bacterium]